MNERIVLNRPIPSITETINVKHYGAKGNGSTDDRAAIIATLEAAIANLPAIVYFPAGSYAIQDQGIEINPALSAAGLTINGAGKGVTELVLTGATNFAADFHCLKILPPTTPASLSEYMSDFTVSGITFRDSDPATHTNVGGTEETHGLNIQYCKNVSIFDCGGDSIGDEAIELDYCVGGHVSNNYLYKCPHEEQTGGGAISIKNGCEDLVIDGNTILDGNLGNSANTYGINLKVIENAAIKNILITGNTIKNCVTAGVYINAAGTATNSNITIASNLIDNCPTGLLRAGSNVIEFTKFLGNTITNGVNGINISIAAAYNIDCDMVFNTIDTMSGTGIICNGTRLNLSGNNIRNTDGLAISLGSNSIDSLISGGIISACGGGVPDRVINDDSATPTSDIEGVTILDAQSATAIIDGVRSVRNCYIEASSVLLGSRGIDDVQFVTDNILIDTGLRLVKDKSVCNGNHITISSNPSVATIRVNDVNDSVVMNNYVEVTSGTRTAIEETTGANYNNISHNNVRNRGTGTAITVVGANTINQDNIT